MYVVVVQKFTFAISSPDEFLLKDVTVTVTLNILQSIFSTNNASNVTGFRRIFNRNSITTKTQIVNLGAGI